MRQLLICIPVLLSWSLWQSETGEERDIQNVVIVVMDGARFSETFGDTTHANIPFLNRLRRRGVLYTHFYNPKYTYTLAGYTALMTGYNQPIDNTGIELPAHPGIFQYAIKSGKINAAQAMVVASKDKIDVISDTGDSLFKERYRPVSNCGMLGMGRGSGLRSDEATLAEIKRLVNQAHPRLLLAGFAQPDITAHAGNYDNYLEAIRKTDVLIGRLWKFIQADPVYHNNTALIVVNDHGRHLDGVAGGFSQHGDRCEGCRHIFCLALGPGLPKDSIVSAEHSLCDIPSTVAGWLNIPFPDTEGKAMPELFPTDSVESQ